MKKKIRLMAHEVQKELPIFFQVDLRSLNKLAKF